MAWRGNALWGMYKVRPLQSEYFGVTSSQGSGELVLDSSGSATMRVSDRIQGVKLNSEEIREISRALENRSCYIIIARRDSGG